MPISKTWKTRTTTTRGRRMTGRTKNITGTRKSWTSTPYATSRYSTTRKQIQQKIGSFRNLNQQVSGAGKVTAFSPDSANKWIRLVNSGNCIYKFKDPDFCRHFGSKWHTASPTAAYQFLKRKFGTGIKAVTRGKGNSWLVAASPSLSSRPFGSYRWK